MKANSSARLRWPDALLRPGANSRLPPWPSSSPAASSTPLAGAPLSSAACALKLPALVSSRAMGPLRKTGGFGGRSPTAVRPPFFPELEQPAARTALNTTHNPIICNAAGRICGQRLFAQFVIGILLWTISEAIRSNKELMGEHFKKRVRKESVAGVGQVQAVHRRAGRADNLGQASLWDQRHAVGFGQRALHPAVPVVKRRQRQLNHRHVPVRTAHQGQ